jgi:hypothetical protein
MLSSAPSPLSPGALGTASFGKEAPPLSEALKFLRAFFRRCGGCPVTDAMSPCSYARAGAFRLQVLQRLRVLVRALAVRRVLYASLTPFTRQVRAPRPPPVIRGEVARPRSGPPHSRRRAAQQGHRPFLHRHFPRRARHRSRHDARQACDPRRLRT